MNIKTKTRKAISVLMGAVMVMTLFSGLIWEKREVKAADYGIANPVIEDGVATWDTVYFGHYYQSDSGAKEPIRWRVLSVEGDDAFLLADECLDCRPYNEEQTDVTWEDCTLRAWLNDDFYHAAFSSEEQAAVMETDVENHDNPYYGTEGGNDTKDRVYLLSLEEIINTKYGFLRYIQRDTETRQAGATEYAKEQGAGTNAGGQACWWCRSAGYYSVSAAYVDSVGWGYRIGYYVDNAVTAVRPALHLNLSSDLWEKGEQVSAGGAGVSDEDKTPAPEITPNPVHGLDSPATEDGVATWDTVYFGSYYQSSSEEKEPVRWRVLSVEGDDAFLLADECLDCKPYHEEDTSVTWEDCTLRGWLNDDFYHAAFSSEEQAAVMETDVENHDNPYYGTEGGNDTKDKVYLLSLEEIINTKYGFSRYIRRDTETRQAGATEYAKEQGAWTNAGGQAYWWCRSAGYYSGYAACVDSGGWGDDYGDYVHAAGTAVRPALHLNLSSNLWKKGERVSAGGADIESTQTPDPTSEPVTTASPAPSQASDPGTTASPIPSQTTEPGTTASPAPSPTAEPVTTASPAPSPTAEPSPTTEPDKSVPAVSAGDKRTYKNATYTVTSTDEGSGTVTYSAYGKKNAVSVTIPATVTLEGVSYKVTEIADNAFKGFSKLKTVTIGKNITVIGKNAFAGCGKLKTITIKSKVVKKIGKNALSGIHKKVAVKVPKKQYAAYKKLIKAAGVPKGGKIKKM